MWKDLDYAWQYAFELALESFKKGTVPVGAVITDEHGDVITIGRNRMFDEGNHPFNNKYLGHAEMDVLMNLNIDEHPNIREYTLYSTMEPCIMCFGTAVMSNIRNIKFAAHDYYAGGTCANEKIENISRKKINISHVGGSIEFFQIVLQSAYEIKKNGEDSIVLRLFEEHDPNALKIAKKLYRESYFEKIIILNEDISDIYNEIVSYSLLVM